MDTLAYTISYYCFLVSSVLSILIGLLYATRKQIMPYHLKALKAEWDDIDPNYQLLLKALLNGGGFYGISCGFFMLVILLIPFSNRETWAGYAIGTIGLIGALPLAWIVYKVKTKTEGNPPLWIMLVVNALMITGLISVSLL